MEATEHSSTLLEQLRRGSVAYEVGMVTITVSTYMIPYSQALFERLSPWLSSLERRRPFRELEVENQDEGSELEVVVFGLGRYGCRVLATLCEAKIRAIGVDFDPEVVRLLQGRGLPVRFGDGAEDERARAITGTRAALRRR